MRKSAERNGEARPVEQTSSESGRIHRDCRLRGRYVRMNQPHEHLRFMQLRFHGRFGIWYSASF